MDPISLGIQAVGLGLSLFGGMGQAGVASQTAQVSRNIASQEQDINNQKLEQMQLQARRSQIENVRNAQRARAQATAAATSQGASFGSGLQGGLANITDMQLYNAQGINQNLQIGQNIAADNNSISSDKMQLASLQSQSATDAGWASLGGSLMKTGPIIGGLTKDAFGTSGSNGGFNFNSLFGGNSPSGYGTGK